MSKWGTTPLNKSKPLIQTTKRGKLINWLGFVAHVEKQKNFMRAPHDSNSASFSAAASVLLELTSVDGHLSNCVLLFYVLQI